MGTIEAPGLPAVRLAPLRRASSGLQALSPTRTWSTSSAATCSIQQGAQPVGRDAAARLPAAQIHRPHAFQCRAGADRPARRRRTRARRVRQARRPGALTSCRALRSPRSASEVSARPSRCRGVDPAEARHLLDGRHGGRSLRAHDRPGDAWPSSGWPRRNAQDLPRRHACPRRDRRPPPTSRQSCAAFSRCRRQSGGREASAALRLRVPHQPGDPRLSSNGKRDRALQPAGTGDARPRDPHQEPAAGRAGARGRQARRPSRPGRSRAALDTFIGRLPRLFRASQCAPAADRQDRARPDAARRAGAGARPVRAGQVVEGRQDRRRPRRDHGRAVVADAERLGTYAVHSPSPTSSISSTGRSSRPSSAPRPRSRWRDASSS